MQLVDAAEDIRSMRVHGAGRIARHAAEAMATHAQALVAEASSLESYRNALAEAVRTLLATRPTAVSLGNALRSIERAVESDVDSVKELKAHVVETSNAFCTLSLAAVETIGAIGAKRIHDGDRIQTHCNSKAAMAPLKAAFDAGRRFAVQATETRPKHQGYKTAAELAGHGLDVTLIVDSAVRFFMSTIDAVFVGADTVCADGTLVNKIGTSQIALAAHEHNVPFYVCAESYKFSPRTLHGDEVTIEERDRSEIIDPDRLPGVRLQNPVFDFTPPRYITALITERGMIPPQAAYDIVREL